MLLLRSILRRAKKLIVPKWRAELAYWSRRYVTEGGAFRNDHFEPLMLAIAGEKDHNFIQGKIVADFGCGPRGSLVWAKEAMLRIGIDVLADQYADKFTNSILSHDMVYLKSTERVIPLPSNFVDIMFTMNAIDHVVDFSQMCREIVRVIKPGGLLIASINIDEPVTAEEPQTLTEAKIQQHLLCFFDVEAYKVADKGPGQERYQECLSLHPKRTDGTPGVVWLRARKRGEQ